MDEDLNGGKGGGIGGIGLSGPRPASNYRPEDEPEGPEIAAPSAGFTGAQLAQIDHRIRDAIEEARAGDQRVYDAEMAEAVSTLRSQLAQLETLYQTLGGDVQKDRAAIQNVFNQIEARFNALAQRLNRNDRYAAMDMAVRGRAPGEPHKTMVANAEAFLAFIAPPEPDSPALGDEDERQPAGPGETTH